MGYVPLHGGSVRGLVYVQARSTRPAAAYRSTRTGPQVRPSFLQTSAGHNAIHESAWPCRLEPRAFGWRGETSPQGATWFRESYRR